MEIKILGTGCPKCQKLEKAVRDSIAELALDASVSKVEDIMKIMEYGIMHTPGLVVNGKVMFSGRLPSSNELKQILTQNR
ncbi:MAG: TM0996/MTH895 family glutaredoxin-like protein [Bacteroidales bacterium]|nr:TM0996/MTH895 family glutaredoxin-like protein [Bacteroidales bacterium]MBN2698758.1 TM0996/MTH895 family glutaredoxin-like protein [Bacteroidales bacterium]